MRLFVVLLCFVVACEGASANNKCQDDSKNFLFLKHAQELHAPIATSTVNGEAEGADFWSLHSTLLKQAWKEWEVQQQDDLPLLFIDKILNDTVRYAVNTAWNDPQKETKVRNLWREVAPNVYKAQLLNPRHLETIRTHLDKALESKIPTRRPNGMNRYGMILHPTTTDGSVVLHEFGELLSTLINTYIRPMGRVLFSNFVSKHGHDDANTYAFTIRYQQDQDVLLREHSDASLYTCNINLNLPNESYDGSSLYFVDSSTATRHYNITLNPGEALLHFGQIRHASLPISSGSRTNLVVWFFGMHGDVRIAPYQANEILSREERWSYPTISNEEDAELDYFEL